MRDPDFTLSAGPVTATPGVLAALGSPIVYHYDPAFIERFRATERKLAQVFLTENDVLLMQGEAVLGLEAAARGLVQPGTKVLNLVQGVFGKGMGYWLKGFGAELHELEVAYNDAVDPADVERYLDDNPGIELVTGLSYFQEDSLSYGFGQERRGTSDFTTILQKVRAAKPDVFISAQFGAVRWFTMSCLVSQG